MERCVKNAIIERVTAIARLQLASLSLAAFDDVSEGGNSDFDQARKRRRRSTVNISSSINRTMNSHP
jgi:hypothetical protein